MHGVFGAEEGMTFGTGAAGARADILADILKASVDAPPETRHQI